MITMTMNLTDAQLQHFAAVVFWIAVCGGAVGALLFAAIYSLAVRGIVTISNAIDRRTRIYVARIRANALMRVNGNG